MHTRSQTRNLHNQQQQAPPPVVEPFNLEEPLENPPPPPPPMEDQRTMAQLLEAPTEGYEDAIVVLKSMLTLTPTPVKAVEESCVTCGGAHSYQTCPATSGNVYRDNIQEYVSQAAAANFNKETTGFIELRFQIIIRPSMFFLRSKQSYAKARIQSESVTNQTEEFHSATDYQSLVHTVKSIDLTVLVNANDAVMRNCKLWSQHAKSIEQHGIHSNQRLERLCLGYFIRWNTASTSGTLPSNTVTNPKEDLKGITTRSGVAYKGPTIPVTSSSLKFGITEDVPPPLVPIVNHESISEPANAPVSASRPNQKASILFPSRRMIERSVEKANEPIEKF
ncbi:hypothetical protein Tco_0558035 [Tanacetum coccineum]